MNSTVSVLKRWRAMDAALCPGAWGLNVPRFARKWGVSTRTVYRDLEAFRQMGQRIDWRHPGAEEVRDYLWHYRPGVEPLFLCNGQTTPPK